MTMLASDWRIDPDDPRAPPVDVWDRMSPEERARVVASLPSEFPLSASMAPEGELHFDAKVGAKDALRGYFDRIGRKVYLACDLPVYYPGEAMFAPDVIAVLDAPRKQRNSWVVSAEGKGVDLAIEVHVAGDCRKDLERKAVLYSQLGIREYFIFDLGRRHVTGYRLETDKPTYHRIVPQGGMWASQVLGLELGVKDGRIRFFTGMALLPEPNEQIVRLEQRLDQVEAGRAEEARQYDEIELKLEETEQRLAEALAEIDRLKRERSS